jgi:site-specific DNA recombinase
MVVPTELLTAATIPTTAVLRAAIYARISREDEGNVDNTDIQVDEGQEFIGSNNWECVSVYVDDNRSAYSERRRKDYERLLVDIQANKIDVIVCTEVSRLNRRLWHSIDLFRMAETTSLSHIATTDGGGLNLSTPEGIQNAIKLAMEAENESRQTSRRMKRKHRVLANAGKANGGFRPFGHERTGKGELKVYDPEAVIVREIVRRLLDGESGRSVLHDLRQRGIETTTGKDFHASDLVRIIESPRLCGLRTHLGTLHDSDYIEPIISREDWETLQVVWRARAANRGVQARRYLLSGIVACGQCDTPMVGRNWHDTRTGKTYHRYICPKDEAYHHRPGCGKVFRNADPIDLLISEAVLYRLDSPEFLAALGTQTNEGELQELLNRRQAKIAKRDSLYSDYLNDLISKELWLRGKGELEDMIEAINRQLASMQSGRSLARIPLDGTLRAVWVDADLDFKRDLIKLVVKKIVVLPGRTQKLTEINGQRFRFDPSLIRIVWEA